MPTLKQSFLTIAIGLALAAGLSYAWTGPTANPPENNAPAPVNVSNLSQIKTGALQVNGFRNVGNSIFDGLATFNSSIKIPTGAGSGKVLISDAEGKASWGSGGGGVLEHGKKLFTANATFTVPADITKVWVSMSGGGAGGGGGQYCSSFGDSSGGGGGGGAESFMVKEISVVSGETIAITIGAGGIGGDPDVDCLNLRKHRGGAGGDSFFGSYLTARGGGKTGTRTQPGNSGGVGGSSGQAGNGLALNLNSDRLGGSGGGSIFGSGGNASYYNGGGDNCGSVCRNGSGYGGGGAGGRGSNDAGGETWQVTERGGDGASGFVLVEW